MKKLYTLLLLLPVQAMAQPTLPQVENYTVGFSARYIECSPAAFGSSGANQVWDFSGLTPLAANDTTMVSVTAVPNPPMFTGANMVLHQAGRTIYLNKTSAETFIVGMYDTAQDAKIHYTDPVKAMTRPVTFGMNYTDNCTEIDTLQGAPGFGSGDIVVTADGWGKLRLPYGDTFHNVIRVKSVQTQLDTVDFLGNPVDVTIVLTTYAWYDDAHQAALLQMINVDLSSTAFPAIQQDNVYYLVKENYPSNVPAVNGTESNIAAHLSDNQLVLKGDLDVQKNYHAVMYDIAGGRQVLSRSFTATGGINVLALDTEPAAGVYVVVLKDVAGATNVIKLVKE